MTLLTEAIDVFAAAEPSGRCLVAFIAKRAWAGEPSLRRVSHA
jgi:hypothetical protein